MAINLQRRDVKGAPAEYRARSLHSSTSAGSWIVIAILLFMSSNTAQACATCAFNRMGCSLEVHTGVRLVVGIILAASFFDLVRFSLAWIVYALLWNFLYRFCLWNLLAGSGAMEVVSGIGLGLLTLGVLDVVVVFILGRFSFLRAWDVDRIPLWLPMLYVPVSIIVVKFVRIF